MEQPLRVVLLVGLPASGKSSWAREQGVAVLSTDEMRHLLSDDVTNQTIHRPVFATLRYLLRRRLELRRPLTIVDATNLTRGERRTWIRFAQIHGGEPEAVFFDVPLEVCKQRNRSRDRVVPEWAMDLLASRLTPPALEEGFRTITVVKDLRIQNRQDAFPCASDGT